MVRRLPLRTVAVLAGVFSLVSATRAGAQSADDLKRLTLEELTRLPVTIVSRTEEPNALVPAAVFVITANDIRRAGVTTLAEAVALAPGVYVAHVDGNKWAVGIRGFTDRLSRAMLVMIDGRALYSSLFAGTYWEVQDVLLADIDRIEVVRGPGGTLWGANAVTGIINIVTRSAKETQGLFVEAGAGSRERAFGGVRFGAPLGPAGAYRVYAKAYDRGPGLHADGSEWDTSQEFQAGGRADWTRSSGRMVTLQGDAYSTRAGQRSMLTSYTPPYAPVVDGDAVLSGANALVRATNLFGSRMSQQLQVFFDYTHRKEPTFEETRNTIDVDFQAGWSWRRQRIGWGLGYRVSAGDTVPSVRTLFTPEDRIDQLFNAFVQDDVEVWKNRLHLIAGSRFEHNGYSGFEIQPSVRALWTPALRHTIFAAVTRAVRTPSRVETDLTLTVFQSNSGPLFVRVQPNPGFVAEGLVAYEAGYRIEPSRKVFVTASTFYNNHDHVLSTETSPVFAETAPAPAHLVLPLVFGNGLEGHSYGVELTADARPAGFLRLTSSYSYLLIDLQKYPDSHDASQEARAEGLTPKHQFQFSAAVDLARGIAVNWWMRSVGGWQVSTYTTANARVAWQGPRGLEVALVAKDFLSDPHLEFPGGAPGDVQIERSAFVQITFRR